jgi:hypothetical protein
VRYNPRKVAEAITRCRNEESSPAVGAALGMPESTVRDWRRRDEAGTLPSNILAALGDKPATTARDCGESVPEHAPGVRVSTDGDVCEATLSGAYWTAEASYERSGLDPDEWQYDTVVDNSWGEPGKRVNRQIKVRFERIPRWMRSDAFDPPRIRQQPSPRPPGQQRTALVFGDAHIGFDVDFQRREFVPYHDEHALDLALQVIAQTRPDTIVANGDMIDCAALSTKFARSPAQRYTLQPAVERTRTFAADIRRAAPRADIYWTHSNHGAGPNGRLAKYLREKADELSLLRDADGEILLTVEALLGLPALDIQCVPSVDLGPVDIAHGDVARSGAGATSSAYLQRAARCKVRSHLHRDEHANQIVDIPGRGRQVVWASVIGCLCHTDGRVPGNAGVAQNWQRSMGLVTYTDEHAKVDRVDLGDGVAYMPGGGVLTART